MKLVPNAKKVARHSWAVRAAVLSAVVSSVQVGMALVEPEHPSLAYAVVAAGLAFLAAAARLIQQEVLHEGE